MMSSKRCFDMRGFREATLTVADDVLDDTAVEATDTGRLAGTEATGGGIADDAEVGLLIVVVVGCGMTMGGIVDAGLLPEVGLPMAATLTRRRAGSASRPDGMR